MDGEARSLSFYQGRTPKPLLTDVSQEGNATASCGYFGQCGL